jgi:hypothetical protein
MDPVRRYQLNWKWNREEHSALWQQLWTNKNHHSHVARIFLGLVLALPTVSLANFLISKEQDGEAERGATRGMDIYIAVWAAILTATLWFGGAALHHLPRWAKVWIGLGGWIQNSR